MVSLIKLKIISILFQIPALKRDRYNLTAEGISGVEFTNETMLNFEDKEISVLVQTDKSIYKPGDKVNYRILVLDSNLRPAKISAAPDVVIKVGNANYRSVCFQSNSCFPLRMAWAIEFAWRKACG